MHRQHGHWGAMGMEFMITAGYFISLINIKTAIINKMHRKRKCFDRERERKKKKRQREKKIVN